MLFNPNRIFLKDYLGLLASRRAVPGGGSAAALAGAMGSALGKMAASLTATRKLKKYLKRFQNNLNKLLVLSEKDCRAYQSVLSAYALPKNTPMAWQQRARRIQSAVCGATQTPLETMATCLDVLKCLNAVAPLIKPTVKSDFGVAVLLTIAGLKGALMNVKINLDTIKKQGLKDKITKQTGTLLRQATKISGKITLVPTFFPRGRRNG